MAKLKLPEKLKSWKVVSALADKNGYPAYSVSRVEFDGSATAAVLTCIEFEGDEYNSENVDLVQEEAAFIKSVMNLRGVSNYIDAVVENEPARSTITLFLLTGDYPTLRRITRGKALTDSEVVDFGLQMSEVLDKLESNNILHGNINPDTIYLDNSGHYVLGDFTAFEGGQDPGFTAPEIQYNESPDITTDIYSLGLVMYTMSNNGRLPFEDAQTDRSQALAKRFSKAPITAPANGNEKLKSVIVIACQPENRNRWKNAGNLRNALASIKAELPVREAPAAPVIPVIVPEKTAFESNVFEEFAFDEFEEATPAPAPEEPAAPVEEAPEPAPAAPVVPETPAAPETPAENPTETVSTNAAEPTSESSADPEIDNRVFDEYQPQPKVINIRGEQDRADNDYGDYFEEEPEKQEDAVAPVAAAAAAAASTPTPVNVAEQSKPQNDTDKTQVFNANSFYQQEEEDEDASQEKTTKKKTGLIIGIAAAAVVLAAVGTVGFLGASNGWFSGGGKQEETTAPETTAAATTAPATQPTTVPSTTFDPNEEIYPENVVGTFYDYGEYALKEQGFKVEIGEFVYNDDFDYGFVISMSPDSSEKLKRGSTITLTVSRGSENSKRDSNESSESSSDSESSEESSESENDRDDDSDSDSDSDSDKSESSNTEASAVRAESSVSADNASFSEFKGNTSYFTEAEVNKMSREELNLTLNEIYARRGRIFKDSSLSAYFQSKSWYKPVYNADEFVEHVVFNDYEEKNLTLLRQKQLEKGYL